MTHFLSTDDPFPIDAGSDSLFSPLDSLLEPPPPPSSPSVSQQHPPQHSSKPLGLPVPSSQSLSRKRARNSPSTNNNNNNTHPNSNNNKIKARDLAENLLSKDPNEVNDALNTLLKLSSDHDRNYALGRNGHLVINSLVSIYDESIGWKHGNSDLERNDNDDDDDDLSDLTPSSKTWKHNASPSKVGNQSLYDFDWPTFCATKLAPAPTSLNTAMTPSHINPSHILSDVNNKEQLKRLEIIIMIIRNLSFGKFLNIMMSNEYE